MSIDVRIIRLPLPLRLVWVNCYLISTSTGHVLIDTGGSNARKALRMELEKAGCTAGSLNLAILTHGDFDHTGNAAYVRSAFGTRLAMHREDAAMAERGDMFANRRRPNRLVSALIPVFAGFGKAERFAPDVNVDDGYDLSAYGLDARVISLPGHSKGSIGVLTAHGDLFCGDLFDNTKEPALNTIMDDPAAARTSVAHLDSLPIRTVYPGHGQPFAMSSLAKDTPRRN